MNKLILNVSLLAIAACTILPSCKREYRLFAGSYTSENAEKGLSVINFNSSNGSLRRVSSTDAGPAPSYFCVSKKNSLFYVINEVMEFSGNAGGGLTTLKYNNKNLSFEKLNEMVIPNGGPCYISMSPDSAYLFVANYPEGSVVVVSLDANGIPERVTDTLLFDKEEPGDSHAHMILSDPEGKHVYLTDLGLNRITVFDFDGKTGKLEPLPDGIVQLPAGTGPRHFVFNDRGTKLYLINEVGSSVMAFDVGDDGRLKLISTLPTIDEKFNERNACADIHLGKNGRFLYGSNRGENTIVTYKVAEDGTLSFAGRSSCGGEWPRNFTLDPSGRFLLAANQKSGNITVFRIDKKTGLPSQAVDSIRIPQPVCLKFAGYDAE